MQQTLVLIKPDAVRRGLRDEIIRRIHATPGLRISMIEKFQVTRQAAEEHYEEHKNKPFFNDLVEFTISSPMYKLILEGPDAIEDWRQLMGATDLAKAEPGTIRGDLGHFRATPQETLVHGSDSPESAEREITLFFA